ncbi:hypothetical protein [uncultured Roseobacter sp.]|uniref:hypothetical protein n=1 Tax=uncultured Roseobacter sp. TaxID=114847 RepID=UPI002630D084|nr:hypothetical protein [uncultured Roseobacter sp.]
MLEQIVLHPGFHKTGTSSLQQTMGANKKRLPDRFGVLLRPQLVQLSKAVFRYAQSRDDAALAVIRREAGALAANHSDRIKTLLISEENLSGPMPGRAGAHNYGATRSILQAMTEGILHTSPDCRICVFFTTRQPGPWLKSCYWQCMRRGRVGMSEDAFAERYQKAANLAEVVAEVTDALPEHLVVSTQLEDCTQRRLGPLDALLDLTDIPNGRRARIVAHPIAHKMPPLEIQKQLIKLDQSDLSDKDLVVAKRALIDAQF